MCFTVMRDGSDGLRSCFASAAARQRSAGLVASPAAAVVEGPFAAPPQEMIQAAATTHVHGFTTASIRFQNALVRAVVLVDGGSPWRSRLRPRASAR